ncbi:hypothetical protein SVAN01_04899 [Stagonosporopsis vannaccii]|nr:hypothetical protein SVAN01_04899 [Stagonosporopsis vannaccii]
MEAQKKRGRGRPRIHPRDESGKVIIEVASNGERVIPTQKYDKVVRAGGTQSSKPAPAPQSTPKSTVEPAPRPTPQRRVADEFKDRTESMIVAAASSVSSTAHACPGSNLKRAATTQGSGAQLLQKKRKTAACEEEDAEDFDDMEEIVNNEKMEERERNGEDEDAEGEDDDGYSGTLQAHDSEAKDEEEISFLGEVKTQTFTAADTAEQSSLPTEPLCPRAQMILPQSPYYRLQRPDSPTMFTERKFTVQYVEPVMPAQLVEDEMPEYVIDWHPIPPDEGSPERELFGSEHIKDFEEYIEHRNRDRERHVGDGEDDEVGNWWERGRGC